MFTTLCAKLTGNLDVQLVQASKDNDVNLVLELLKKGANVNYNDSLPLQSSKSLQIFELLVNAGATGGSKAVECLTLASRCSTHILDIFLQRNPNIDVTYNNNESIRLCRPHNAKTLIALGADVHANNDEIAIYLPSWDNGLNCVRILEELNVDWKKHADEIIKGIRPTSFENGNSFVDIILNGISSSRHKLMKLVIPHVSKPLLKEIWEIALYKFTQKDRYNYSLSVLTMLQEFLPLLIANGCNLDACNNALYRSFSNTYPCHYIQKLYNKNQIDICCYLVTLGATPLYSEESNLNAIRTFWLLENMKNQNSYVPVKESIQQEKIEGEA